MLCRYKVYLHSLTNSYKFSTDTGAEYEVLFSRESSIFSSTSLENEEIYSFAINKVKKGSGKADMEIQITISAILNHFFTEKNRILTYVFDSTDGKELIRKRLFQIWETREKKNSEIVKIDSSIITEDLTYQTGILFHSGNSIGKQIIIETFDLIISELTEK